MGLLNYLPDDPNKKEAMRQGLLQFGAALLGGHGNFGQIIGHGIGAGAEGYGGSLQQSQKDELEAAQLKLLQNKDTRAQRLDSILTGAFGTSAGANQTAPAPMPSSAPGASNIAPIGALPTVGSKSQPFPMTLQQIAVLKASGGPDLSAEYKMANEGFERKQGSAYDMPDGTRRTFAKLDNGQLQGDDGSIMTAPGYNDALATTEGLKAAAIEKAKADYDLLDPTKFVGADGRPVGGTRSGYIAKVGDLPKVGATPPARAPVRSAGPAGFPVVTPQQQRERDGGRLDILRAERAKATDPADIAALDREISGTRGPVLQSAAESKAQVGAVDTRLNAGNKINDNWITNVHNPVQLEGKAAKTTLTQLDTIKNVNFETGWGSEAKTGAANILASLGVKDAAKYAAKSQVFQQVAMERNMTQLAAQAGPQTEGDSLRAQQTFMMLKNTPAANQFIADLTGANARIAARKADYYNQALPLARASGDLTEIDRRWAKIAPSVWADPALARYKAKK